MTESSTRRLLQKKQELGLSTQEPPKSDPSGREDRFSPDPIPVLIVCGLLMIFLSAIVAVIVTSKPASKRRPGAPAVPPFVNGPQAPASQPSAFVPPTSGAVIAGQVTFGGMAQTVPVIPVASSPSCPATVPNESVVINPDGTLSNVVVYIQSGLKGQPFTLSTTPALMDFTACRYAPHVLAVTTQQPVVFHNAGPSVENLVVTAPLNGASNNGMPLVGMRLQRSFGAAELPISLSSGVHPWATGYIAVFDHPYFNVTNKVGVFRFDGLSDGTYVIASWHEKLGPTTQTVTVKSGEVARLDIAY